MPVLAAQAIFINIRAFIKEETGKSDIKENNLGIR